MKEFNKRKDTQQSKLIIDDSSDESSDDMRSNQKMEIIQTKLF